MKFRKARFQHDMFEGFWVTLYFIFDGVRTYTCFDESEWLENGALMTESGVHIHTFAKDILCTPIHLSGLYQEVLNVLASGSN